MLAVAANVIAESTCSFAVRDLGRANKGVEHLNILHENYLQEERERCLRIAGVEVSTDDKD